MTRRTLNCSSGIFLQKCHFAYTCWIIIEVWRALINMSLFLRYSLGKIWKPKKIFHKSSTQLSKQIHQQHSAMNVRTEELVTYKGNIFCTYSPTPLGRTAELDSLFTMGNFETTFKKVFQDIWWISRKRFFSTQIFTSPHMNSIPNFYRISDVNMACWRHLSISCHAS